MLRKGLITFLLCLMVVSLEAIPLEFYQRNIPVEVRYDNQVVKVIPREVQARRNLDAQVQLSTEQIGEALKHLPIQDAPYISEAIPGEKVQLSEGNDVIVKEVQPAEKSVGVVQEPVPAIKSLIEPDVQENAEIIQGKAAISPAQLTASSLDKVLQESHQIITKGLKNLRETFKPGKDQFSPSVEQWATLEKAVDTYFDEEKQKLLIRQQAAPDASAPASPAPDQNQNNWIQNIVNGFNGITSNFVQSIQSLGGPNNGGTPSPQGQGDEGTPAQPPNQGFQGFIQFFNNGISNIVSTITGANNNGPTTSTTNLSDPGASQPQQPSGPIGFFGAIVSNVQNALGIQQQPQQPTPGAQGDTGAPVQQQQNGPVQVIQSVGNAITSFFQGGVQNRPPNAAGDEGAAPVQSSNTNIIQNIQNAIQNSPLNPFRPQGGTNNQNPVQNAIQSVGTQAQQLIPSAGQTQSPDSAKKPAEKPQVQPAPVKENEISKKEVKSIPLAIA